MAIPTLIMDLAYNQLLNGSTAQAIGFLQVDEEEVLNLEIYRFIINSIRKEDEKNGLFLKRFLEGPQEIWGTIQSRIFEVKNFWDISEVEDEYLQYVKNIVGWTSDLDSITDALDSDTLRRLIATSVALWKERGPEEALINVLGLTTQASSKILNWFDYRWVVDENYVSEERQGGDIFLLPLPGPPENEEYYSNLRIVDDGTLNKDLVIALVKLMRAVSERFIITYLNFLELFTIDDDKTKWTERSGILVVQNGTGKLANPAAEESVYANGVKSTWVDQVLYWRIKIAGLGFVGVEFDSDGSVENYYRVDFSIGANTITLYQRVSGFDTTLATVNYDPWGEIYSEVWFGVRVEFVSPVIKIFVDNNLVIDIEHVIPKERGTFGFFHQIAATIEVDEMEAILLPIETDEIGINE